MVGYGETNDCNTFPYFRIKMSFKVLPVCSMFDSFSFFDCRLMALDEPNAKSNLLIQIIIKKGENIPFNVITTSFEDLSRELRSI